jgi:pimeloyl-ACP methyl ester carboxylesterase
MAAVNGVELFVRRFGDRSLPPLIVIHGGPTWDHSYLLPAVAALADRAHVVLFDLRGCGRSSRTPPVGRLPVSALQPDYLADDVAALVGWLGAGRADVLGFSYGGGVAMRVAAQHPGLVRRLIVASTTAYRELGPPADPQEFSGDDGDDGALSRAMAYHDAPAQIWRLDRLAEWHRVLENVRFSSDWNAPYADGLLRPAAPDNAPEVLRAWGGPLLILHGRHDLGFPVAVARRLHTEVPGSTLAEIPDAGHMAHFDNPPAWIAALRNFLASVQT